MQRDIVDVVDRGLIDQLAVICVYRDWRDASADSEAAYARFADSERAERRLAFAAYRAALDREEAAARAYASRLASRGA